MSLKLKLSSHCKVAIKSKAKKMYPKLYALVIFTLLQMKCFFIILNNIRHYFPKQTWINPSICNNNGIQCHSFSSKYLILIVILKKSHTHIFCFAIFVGTLHRPNCFYTVKIVYSITGNFLHFSIFK